MGTRQLGMFYLTDGTETTITLPFSGTKIEAGTFVSMDTNSRIFVADGSLALFGVVCPQKIYQANYITVATKGFVNAIGTADMVIGTSPYPSTTVPQAGVITQKLNLIDLQKKEEPNGVRVKL